MRIRAALLAAAAATLLSGCGSPAYSPSTDSVNTIQQSNGPTQMAPQPGETPGSTPAAAGQNAPTGN